MAFLARAFATVLLTAGLALPATAATKAPAKAAARDWTKVFAATPEGGYRIGNPAAKVKLVEYGSVWCPHCKHFHDEGVPALKARYISTGNVSYEIRNFVLNQPDLAATLAVQCGGLPSYFRMLDAFYAGQEAWEADYLSLSEDALKKTTEAPAGQRILALARAMKLDAFSAKAGLPAARFTQCLSDKAAFDRVVASNNKASEMGVNGTPTFFINGQIVPDTGTWDALEPALRAAL